MDKEVGFPSKTRSSAGKRRKGKLIDGIEAEHPNDYRYW